MYGLAAAVAARLSMEKVVWGKLDVDEQPGDVRSDREQAVAIGVGRARNANANLADGDYSGDELSERVEKHE